ncbi:MAG: type II secretion system F family protein [Acidobacteria bacterium]|nr:type II secretion system F family protein [Acidobacteriota bacterium]
MPDFAYVAVGPDGERVEGTASASSEDALAKMLRAQDRFLVTANPAESDTIDLASVRVFERISRRDIIFFTTQLSTIVSNGVLLVDGLADIERQASTLVLKRITADVRRDIENGLPLSSALERHPVAFDELYVNIVRAGEATGRVGRALDDLAAQQEWQDDLAARIREATTYPLIVVGLLSILLVVLVGFTIPQFTRLYQNINAKLELPLATRIVQIGATSIASNWYVILALISLAYVWYRFRVQTPDGAIVMARRTLHVPVLGDAVRKIALSRFAHYFGTLHEAGLEVVPTLALIERVIGNAYLSSRFRLAANRVIAGEPLSGALTAVGEFPPVVIQMLSLGEKTGEVSTSLEQVRRYYDREVDRSVKRALTLFGPIALVGLASIFVLIAVAFYLPMFNLARAIRP